MDVKAAKRMERFAQFAVAAQRKRLSRQALTWKRKILTVWASALVQESEAAGLREGE